MLEMRGDDRSKTGVNWLSRGAHQFPVWPSLQPILVWTMHLKPLARIGSKLSIPVKLKQCLSFVWCDLPLYISCHTTCMYHLMCIILCLLHHPACMCVHMWWSVVSLFLLFNAGRTQCLSLVCWGWPPCCCSAPCSQDGGPPLWYWWSWIHSLALGIPFWSFLHGGVPHEILWIWCEGNGQGWLTLFAACLMQFVTSLDTPVAWAQD